MDVGGGSRAPVGVWVDLYEPDTSISTVQEVQYVNNRDTN